MHRTNAHTHTLKQVELELYDCVVGECVGTFEMHREKIYFQTANASFGAADPALHSVFEYVVDVYA